MYPCEIRQRAIIHYIHFLRSLRKVAKLYNISKSTIQRWVKKSELCKIRRRSKKRIHDDVRECIESCIFQNPFITWDQLAISIRKNCNVNLSRSTAGRMLHRLDFTRKKAFKIVRKEHNPLDILSFCDSYSTHSESIICIDEACFYVGDKGTHGYSKKGTRLNIEISRTLRRKKYTLIMAISRQGVVGYEILDRNCTTQIFKDFVDKLQVPKGSTLLMDNVQFHKSYSVQESYRRKGITPLYIPPYSPKMNAIENVFSSLKREYRCKCPTRVDDLFDYIGTFKRIIESRKDFNTYFDRVNNHVHFAQATHGINFDGHD